MEEKILHSFQINEQEEIRIVCGVYEGKPFIDQRVYFKAEEQGDYRPSKKALRINPKYYFELKKGIARVENELSRLQG